MGYRLFWDGHWVWPEGLGHYVERHDLYLPEPFVVCALSGATIACGSPADETTWDEDYWLAWSRENSAKRGAQPNTSMERTRDG